MRKSVLTAAVVVVLVVALVGSYIYMSGDDAETAPVLKDGFETGDYYIIQTETVGEEYTVFSNTTYTVTSTDGDTLTVEISTNGGNPETMTVPADQFLMGIVYDDSSLEGLTMTGTDTLETPFGVLECEVWTVTHGTWAVTEWILPDSRVTVLEESVNTAAPQSMTVRLLGGSIFANLGTGAEPEPAAELDVRTEYSAGDFYAYETIGYDGQRGEVRYTYLYEENGQDIVWRSDEGLYSTDGFLDLMIPADDYLADLAKEGSVVLVTGFGDLLCDIWYGETGSGDVMLWIDRDSGVMVRSEYSWFLDGEYVTSSSSLSDTSLLDPSSPMDHTGVGYTDEVVDRDVEAGDFFIYSVQAGEEEPEELVYMALGVDGDSVTYLTVDSLENSISVGTEQEFTYTFMPGTGDGEILGSESISTVSGDVECLVVSVTAGEVEYTAWIGADSGVNYRAESTIMGIRVTMTLTATSLLAAS